MKNIQLKSIALKDWKGRNIEINFNQDHPTTITGRNGIGKTSVMKAFLWLLTGRTDASGKVNSELFDNTQELTQFTPPAIVEATIAIDGVEHTLIRSARAKFKRPKGQVEWVKDTSDEYKFSIDSLPYNATDYDGWISAQITNTNLLPVCILGEAFSNFTENDRAKARKLLTDLIGEQKPDPSGYPEIIDDLTKNTADEIVKLCNTNIKNMSDELTEIPTKIKVHRDNAQFYREAIENGDTHKQELERLKKLVDEQQQQANKKIEDAKAQNAEFNRLNELKKNIEGKLNDAKIRLPQIDEKLINNSRQYEELHNILESNHKKCPTCGSDVKITDDEIKVYQEKIAGIAASTDQLLEEKKALVSLRESYGKQLAEIVLPEIITADTTSEQNEIQRLNALIANEQSLVAVSETQRYQLTATEAAITTLEHSQKENGINLAMWERKKIDIDRYVQDASDLLSTAVNNNLKETKIMMFETHKNGEKKPSCIITNADGVKYSTLNFSARMLCNIEISRMFCRLLDINIPCFVDECSVFDSKHLPKVEGAQMIYMRCSDDERLTVL